MQKIIQTPITSCNQKSNHSIQTHTFKKELIGWYIDLPEYLAQGWNKEDLAMKEGAYKLLNIIADGRDKIIMLLSNNDFEGADVLELQEHCDAPRGGAIYLLNYCRGQQIDSLIWVCDIALFVFGDLPERIYFQRIDTL